MLTDVPGQKQWNRIKQKTVIQENFPEIKEDCYPLRERAHLVSGKLTWNDQFGYIS